MTRRCRTLLIAAALCAAAARPATAQVPGAEASQVLISRQALEDLALRLEQTAESRTLSSAVRNGARIQAQLVRSRLRDGDFQVGDRIRLVVEAETSLTAVFTVMAGRQVSLPGVGMLPLTGVLRVELTDHVTRYLSQFLRAPRVRAESLIRVAVIGGVRNQGYFTVSVDIPVDSVIGLAQGLSPSAIVDRISIERDRETLYEGAEMQRVIAEGQTLDALSIRQGDRIVVPELKQTNPLQKVQTILYLLQIPLTLYTVYKLLTP